MKFLKRLLLLLLVLVAIALVTALFVKKDFGTSREVVINKSKTEVFNYLKLLKNQDNFSKWASLDPAMKKDFKGTDGTVGATSIWSSEKGDVGSGEQEIKKIVDGESIDYELRFLKPIKSTSSANITTTAVNDSTTKVAWSFKGSMSYPFNIMHLFMDMEKSVGDDFSTGLGNLKKIMEK
jgi:hypothetical protein